MKIALTLISFLLLSLQAQSAFRVAIDPGHGGNDKGAHRENINESQVTLKISQKLNKLLKKNKKFETLLLRNKDSDLSLEKRVSMAKKFKSNLFISIHANAHENKFAQGGEFYILNQLPSEEENLFLAHHEQQAEGNKNPQSQNDIESILFDLNKTHRILESYKVSQSLRRKWTGSKKTKMIRQGPFYVLSQTETPAVLIEVGYISNPKERAQLVQASVQQQIARRIYNGLIEFTKNMDKTPNRPLKRELLSRRPKSGKNRSTYKR